MSGLWLKQSTSVTVQIGPFLDKTDGVSLEVGLGAALDSATTGIRLTKNGATQVDRNDATVPAYTAMGLYTVVLDATDTGTLGTLRIIFEEAATCLPVWQDFMIVPANVYDSFVLGTDVLDVSLTEVNGAAQTATLDTIKAETVLIVADTNELQTDWADGGRLDLIQDIIAADTTTDIPALIATAQADLDTITGTSGVLIGTDAANVTEISDAVWDEAQSGHTTAGTFGEIATETAAILVDTGTTIPGTITTLQADTDDIQTRIPTTAELAYIVDNANTGLPVTFTTSGGSTTAAVLALVDGSAGSAVDDQYNGRLLVFTDGTLKGVVTDITDYTGSSTTAVITAIPTAPTASHNARLI